MIWAFLTTILYSLSAVTANRSAKLVGSTDANFWRLAWATVLLALWSHSFGYGLSGNAFPWFLLSGMIGFGLGDVALFNAYPRLGSRLTILIVHCSAAPLASLAEWLWLGTTLSWKQMLCGGVILSGVTIALAPADHPHIDRKHLGLGVLFSIIAGAGQALGAVISRKAYQVGDAAHQNIDGITAAYQRIIAGVIICGLFLLFIKRDAVVAVFTHRPKHVPDPENRWSKAWPWILVNGLAGPSLGVSCQQWALKTTPTGIVLPIIALTPLVIIPFSWYFEKERPSPRSLVGGLIGVAGVIGLRMVT